MREKKQYVIFAFSSTTQAMAAESFFQSGGLPGRLIPVPREITAGCGFAWRAPVSDRELLVSALRSAGLGWESVTELMLY